MKKWENYGFLMISVLSTAGKTSKEPILLILRRVHRPCSSFSRKQVAEVLLGEGEHRFADEYHLGSNTFPPLDTAYVRVYSGAISGELRWGQLHLFKRLL